MQTDQQATERPLLVLFTGAGFSAHAGAPLMRDFLTAASCLPDDVGRGIRAGFYVTGYAMHERPNLETAFGSMVFREVLHGPAWKVATTERDGTFVRSELGPTTSEAINAFEQGIAMLYAAPTHDGTRRVRWIENYTRFFVYLLRHFRLGIVTTNYDLVAEVALQTIGQVSSYCAQSEVTGENAIPILKLHGSVNWAKGPGFNVRVARTEDAPLTHAVILPPTWNKDLGANQPFQLIWRDAVDLIAAADIILAIGHSFPPTDSHLDYLFAEGLSKNIGHPESKRFVVADPDLDSGRRLCERFLRYQTISSASPHAVRFDQLLPAIENGSIRL